MTLNELPELSPADGEVETAELVVEDDVLVKLFALGPGGAFDPHVHDDCENVFHLLDGEVIVTQDDTEEHIEAPAVVHNPRGIEHGARNDGDEPALLTASLCPLP
ncbi:cupin 2 barrel domain protein [Natronomonas pharaonis DSM 2160]|uniref:Cupin 2 barrel domain protein n=1 Tax=Natronomonas pharaonis (strain ATCC 35678 / DSM 2160 / CIP 103997 / JCM 8858 / NBRC 14720 / NCIMB 2260 / Gabara) TaxID=348780 RepID=A0A1U7EZ19_NATPD|nr:cupin domain-containing protein [Natronomonas pharaonis]CAI50491.1 cupin 2 barrel domain protein [Natronomonas pharaonis DSM 2160]